MTKLRLELDELSAETMELAKNELRETPEIVKESLEKLRQLLDDEPNLYFKTDDETLTIFLRPCKWYPESALALMKRVADFKVKYSDTVKDLTAERAQSGLCEHKVVNAVAERDAKGRRIFVVTIGTPWDTKRIPGEELFKLIYLVHLGAMLEPETQCRGIVILLDFNGLGLKHVAQITPTFAMRLTTFVQDAVPLRVKEVHVVNQPIIFKLIWKILKPFLRAKLLSRFHFHGSKLESLHKYMDPEFLPADYGGQRPMMDYSSADWYPVLLSLDDKIREWNTFGWKN